MHRHRSEYLNFLHKRMNEAVYALNDVARIAETLGMSGLPFSQCRHAVEGIKKYRPALQSEIEERLAWEEKERTSPIGKRPFVSWRLSLAGREYTAEALLHRLRKEFDSDPRLTTITQDDGGILIVTKERFVYERIHQCLREVRVPHLSPKDEDVKQID